jgi:NAD(P)-dependent dehydrogenase (short-subunit alcohol dehydrogenase family)
MNTNQKVAVVTGGASGIGRCIAEEFRKQSVRVYVIDKAPGDHYVGDISDKGVLEAFASHVISEAGYCRFVSMSLTALTVCAFYFEAAQRVVNAEWGALMDIMPFMSKVLWICVLISIFINSISLIKPSR